MGKARCRGEKTSQYVLAGSVAAGRGWSLPTTRNLTGDGKHRAAGSRPRPTGQGERAAKLGSPLLPLPCVGKKGGQQAKRVAARTGNGPHTCGPYNRAESEI